MDQLNIFTVLARTNALGALKLIDGGGGVRCIRVSGQCFHLYIIVVYKDMVMDTIMKLQNKSINLKLRYISKNSSDIYLFVFIKNWGGGVVFREISQNYGSKLLIEGGFKSISAAKYIFLHVNGVTVCCMI